MTYHKSWGGGGLGVDMLHILQNDVLFTFFILKLFFFLPNNLYNISIFNLCFAFMKFKLNFDKNYLDDKKYQCLGQEKWSDMFYI